MVSLPSLLPACALLSALSPAPFCPCSADAARAVPAELGDVPFDSAPAADAGEDGAERLSCFCMRTDRPLGVFWSEALPVPGEADPSLCCALLGEALSRSACPSTDASNFVADVDGVGVSMPGRGALDV